MCGVGGGVSRRVIIWINRLQTAQEYEAQYNAVRGTEYSQFHGYAYDAIWTAAATVKSVVHKLHEHNKLVSSGGAGNSDLTFGRSSSQPQTKQHLTIHDFIYRNAKWEELFLESLRNVNFNGVTVHPSTLGFRFQLMTDDRYSINFIFRAASSSRTTNVVVGSQWNKLSALTKYPLPNTKTPVSRLLSNRKKKIYVAFIVNLLTVFFFKATRCSWMNRPSLGCRRINCRLATVPFRS